MDIYVLTYADFVLVYTQQFDAECAVWKQSMFMQSVFSESDRHS